MKTTILLLQKSLATQKHPICLALNQGLHDVCIKHISVYQVAFLPVDFFLHPSVHSEVVYKDNRSHLLASFCLYFNREINYSRVKYNFTEMTSGFYVIFSTIFNGVYFFSHFSYFKKIVEIFSNVRTFLLLNRLIVSDTPFYMQLFCVLATNFGNTHFCSYTNAAH